MKKSKPEKLRSLLWPMLILILLCQASAAFAADVDTTGIEEKFSRLRRESRSPGNADAVNQGGDEIMEMAQAIGSMKYLGRGLYLKGLAAGQGPDRPKALEYLQAAAKLMEAANDSSTLPGTYYSIGALHYLLETHEESQENLLIAIELGKAAKDTNCVAMSFNLMGLIQKQLGNFPVSIDYFEQGIKFSKERGKYMLLQNMGIAYKEMESFDKARQCFVDVANYYEKIGLVQELGITLNNLASVELRQGHAEAAMPHLLRAKELVAQQPSIRLEALIHVNLGYARELLHDCKTAIVDLMHAKALLQQLGERKNLAQAMRNEAFCRNELGDSKRAFELLDSAQTILDSLNDIAKAEAIADLEQKYRQATQKQEIQDLQKENKIISERNEAIAESVQNLKLAAALLVVMVVLVLALGIVLLRFQRLKFLKNTEAEKQQLLRQQIKPHFIFNAMNSIQHFLLNDRKKEGLQYLGKFGALLRLILNNSEKDLVPVEEELKLIRHYLEMEQIRANHKFDFSISVDPKLDPEEIMMPGMALQVLVENAIWHGVAPKEGQGHINIVLEPHSAGAILKILDNGVGLKLSAAKSNPERESFGLSLVKGRIKRAQWGKVSYEFLLEERFDAAGNSVGTQASILFKGTIPKL